MDEKISMVDAVALYNEFFAKHRDCIQLLKKLTSQTEFADYVENHKKELEKMGI